MTHDREWTLRAACRGLDPEIFFPHPRDRRTRRNAERICLDCPVVEQCREYRLAMDVGHGVWAGEYLNEKNFRSAAKPSDLKPCGTSAGYRRHRRKRQIPCESCKRAEALMHAESRARRLGL